MACLLAAFASLSFLRSSASIGRLVTGSIDSSVLHSGQRLAKPGLSGFSSNSSEQMAQTLIGKGIISMIKRPRFYCALRSLRDVYTGFALGLPMVGERYFVATNGSANRRGIQVTK
jgi:hypothetical protein